MPIGNLSVCNIYVEDYSRMNLKLMTTKTNAITEIDIDDLCFQDFVGIWASPSLFLRFILLLYSDASLTILVICMKLQFT